jgi:hypothetical protein
MRSGRGDDLLSLGFPSGTHETELVLVLSAYFDERYQGNGSQGVMAIGGCMSSVKRWNQFARQWRQRVLDPFGLKSFQMRDCEGGGGDFAGWPLGRRREIQSIAMPIIRRWTLWEGASAVIEADCAEELDHLYERHRLRNRTEASVQDPYGWCFSWFLHAVSKWVKEKTAQSPLVLYFDQKEKVEGEPQRSFNEYPEQPDPPKRVLKSITNIDRVSFPPLEAANVLAHEAVTTLDHLQFRPKPRYASPWRC